MSDERPNRLRAAAEEAMAAGLARSVSIVEQSGMVVVSKAEWEAVQGEVAVLRFRSVADATEIARVDRRILSLRAARPTSLPEAPEPEQGPSQADLEGLVRAWTAAGIAASTAATPTAAYAEGLNDAYEMCAVGLAQLLPEDRAATPSAPPVAEPDAIPYAQHEREVMALLKERDDAHEWADRLAYAIAPIDVIGEHSSHNNPWLNALDHAAAPPVAVDPEAGALELLAKLPDLNAVADWLDTFDRMGAVFFDMLGRSDLSDESKARAADLIPTFSSTEVQDDLRSFAAAARGLLASGGDGEGTGNDG